MKKTCKRCEKEVDQNYCPNCGNPVALARIDGKYIIRELGSVFNFDKGLLYTIKALLLHPGQSVIDFIQEDRNRLVKPLVFLIICSLVYTLAEQLFQFEESYIAAGGFGDSTTTRIFEWIQQHYGYANILMAIFIAFWIKIFFRKHGRNIFEIIILLCFVMGIGMLIYSLFGTIESITKLKILHLGGLVGMVYTSLGIGQFFDKKSKTSYWKAFLAYFLGMITFFICVIFMGMGIDML